MVESFRINAVLNLTSNAPLELENLGRRFQTFDRIIKDTQSSMKAMETTMKGLGNARGLSSMVRSMEQLSRVRLGNISGLSSLGSVTTAIERIAGADGKGLSGLARGLEKLGSVNLTTSTSQFEKMATALEQIVTLQDKVATSARETATAWKESAAAMKEGAAALRGVGGTPGGERLAHARANMVEARMAALPAQEARAEHRAGEHDLAGAAMGAGMIQSAIQTPIEKALEAAMEVRERTALLGIAGFDASDMAAAKANAYNVQNTVPGATVGGSLEITKDLYSVIRDAKAATAATADLAATGVILSKVGKGDEVKELFSAMQAGELRGALSQPGSEDIDLKKFQAFIHSIETVSVGTGGRVSPTDYSSFLRQAGVAGVRMSDDAMFQSFPAVMMAMKSVRAGTAMQSFQQSEFGHLAAGYGAEQERIGLIAPGGQTKVGKGGATVIRPGALVNEADAQSNFPHWVFNTLMPKLDKFVDPGNKMNPTDQLNASMRELYNLFPRNTITRMVEDIMRNKALIEKYEGGLGPTGPMAGKDFNKDLFANDPKLHLEQFNAAWTAFMASWGEASMGSVIKYLDLMTNGLNAMAAWARDNPGMAAKITDVAVALGVLAGAITTLSLAAMVLGPGGRILKSAATVGGAAAGGTTGLIAGAALTGLGAGALAAHYFPGDHPAGETSKADQLLDYLGMKPSGAPKIDWKTGNVDFGFGGSGTAAAPTSTGGANQPGSSTTNPLFTFGINTPSGRDIAQGTTDHQANALAGPRAGPTSQDRSMMPQYLPTPF